ncbi:MAG: MFS transporter [Rhodobacter sp.]|nr:MFS transporter [Rhodobacter sp.]
MSILIALRLSRAPGAGLAAVGVLWGGLAASMPDIKAGVAASDAELGGALLASAVGGVLAMLAAPRIGRGLGRFSLPVLGGLVCLAFFFPLLPREVAGLAVAMFFVGASVAALDILTNVEISAREAHHRAHLMGLNHALFSFAFAAAAYGTGLARQAGAGPAEILPVLALACVGLTGVMCLPDGAAAPRMAEDRDGGAGTPWLAVGLTGLILFAAFIGENATEAWSALHIERTLGAAPGAGSFGPAMLGLVMGIGRLFGQVVSERLGHGRLIFASALLGMAGSFVLAVAPTPAVAIAGVAAGALGMAAIVPSAMSILGARVTEAQRAHALSRAWMLGIAGFFVGPALMGGIAELFGLRVSFAAVCLVIALILPTVWALRGQPKVVGGDRTAAGSPGSEA